MAYPVAAFTHDYASIQFVLRSSRGLSAAPLAPSIPECGPLSHAYLELLIVRESYQP